MGHPSSFAAEPGTPPQVPIRRAIISVSEKSGLDEFARALAAAGVELFASGGTRRHLTQLGLEVRDVGGYTGFPEMLDGRVKTLHPKIHGGILCRHDRPDDMQALREHGIVSFELVVVNLYPFEETIQQQGVTDALAIENIDIGGPSPDPRRREEPSLRDCGHFARAISAYLGAGSSKRRDHIRTSPRVGKVGICPHGALRYCNRAILRRRGAPERKQSDRRFVGF